MFLGFISAVAFATILAVVSGLTLSAAAAVSHDIYANVICHGNADRKTELRISRITTLVIGLTTMALAILLGTFGVHRFYMGFVGIGILQAALTVCSFFVLTPFVAVWTFIEGILCFCGAMRDVDGNPLSG